jgi:hypothetical protein
MGGKSGDHFPATASAEDEKGRAIWMTLPFNYLTIEWRPVIL